MHALDKGGGSGPGPAAAEKEVTLQAVGTSASVAASAGGGCREAVTSAAGVAQVLTVFFLLMRQPWLSG